MVEVLAAIEAAIRGVAEREGRAVVGLAGRRGAGSGIVVGEGLVLTNAHNVVERTVAVAFVDGRQTEGEAAGTDPDSDLAVVKVDTGDIAPIERATHDAALGQTVVGLANPGGRGLRATLGWVSSTDRAFRGPRGRRIGGATEHTAPLPRGSSGGPLLDLDGHLVGVNTHRLDGGFYLALPASGIRIEALAEGTVATRPRLGVAVAPPELARRLRAAVGLPDRTGLLVREVDEDSPADRAGIHGGDLLVTAAGTDLDSSDTLFAVLDGLEADSELEIGIIRGAEEMTVTVRFAG